MKRYPENLFSIWETDIGEMSRPSGEGLNGDLFPSFAKRIRHDLDWIDRTVKTINHIDTSNYDSLYRKSSVLSGLSGILKLDNLHHLLLLLEAVCDFARQLRSYDSHSLNYLVTLLKRSILEAIESLESQSFCVIRTAEVIEECRNCLERPMKSFIAERERKREADLESFVHSTTEISDPLPTPSKPLAAPEAPPTRPIMLEGVDDGPEPVNIPIGKIGILSDFCEESRENLTLIGQRLVEMETVSDPTTVVNDIFRGVHTLKAGARMMQVGKLEKLAHELETVLDDIRRNKKPVSSELVDLLFAASDALERMVGEVAAKGPIRTKITPILLSLQKLTLGAPQSEEEPEISDKVTLTVAPTVTE
ncbi:MAG: Hpt domain-containing protein, partial [Bdellovibrionales bacterium]|nr:Hpt domain-containing protein [Bdellovibrionales bacterium]